MVLPTRQKVDRRSRKGSKKHRPEIIVVDLKDHVLGRAAAIVAKQLLLGKKITAVRCEQLTIAGTEIRNKIKYLQFLRKRKLSNPKLGPFHHRSPSDIFLRTVRSMLPRYTKRGQKALRQLVAYEGVPTNVVRTGGRVVIPKAQRHYCYRGERPYTVLGNMCKHVGWKYSDVVKKLETARVEKATRHHKKTEKLRVAWKAARKEALAKVSKSNLQVLKKFGYA
ncbi:large subunit ribosomal protein L13Ae [Trypanosoma rangeli SC58]|uniref:Large subunit ribosomal protein L13Ae n=2 Tax=Trypanosoma rangeli TaxID=5698 RepID=A0A3S5IQR0_TRYRA|nr:large subunit ribosomal protein L13Ae [Trypanosoma rangeli]ESL07946.1 large subunit ribosomal protein L13Ae [Trypanosoma rangeli SC58]RNF01823.1 large subunit ribosomal protein L13Ae [Trypanosoma rangeli]|eukprot:RNF01823.1 large subunit ribosomal protein L13Ae [Trypanosoma rangeli]